MVVLMVGQMSKRGVWVAVTPGMEATELFEKGVDHG